MDASKLSGNSVVGNVEMVSLAKVKPNGWNPNRMAPHVYESLKHALHNDGWLASQALLIWHSDDKGVVRDIIIDGEHRWTVAKELGFKDGPMVFLKGLSESRAKSLTIAMNNRRGQFDDAMLADLVKSLEGSLDNMGLDLAIADEDLAKMLSFEAIETTLGIEEKAKKAIENTNTGPSPAPGPEMNSTVRMVNLFFNASNIDEFTKIVTDLGKRYGTKNITDTVLEAVKREAKAGVA